MVTLKTYDWYNKHMFTLNKHLYLGIILASPFFILNALVVSGFPVLKILALDTFPSLYEQFLILSLISFVFIGGIVSLYPAIRNLRFMVLNILVGILFVGFSVLGGYGMGVDFYHCEILKIPNCD